NPTFTGEPKAPTPAAGNNTTRIATTAFVQAAITALINGAPATLDTLKEIAAAINNDPKFSTTINNALSSKQPLDETLTHLSGKDVAGLLAYLGLGELSIAGVSGGSLTASGYITIPMIINGARRALYIQWGGFTGNTDSSGSNGIYENSNITVTWPVAFPNAVFQVITGGSADVGGVGQQEMTWSLGKTKTYGNFGFQCRTPNASMTGSYLVIGY
ncbi:gp53-like domain-containing protein, partial [Escherichia coli]|uniref:gp53-like domain-containing protein n=1 Tax=Escherichia coli TaxID=562 RepID=UPI003D9A2E15